MTADPRRRVRNMALILLAVLAVSAGAGFLEAGICWDAFIRCSEDPVHWGFLTYGAYCLNGYVFCLKYIEGAV